MGYWGQISNAAQVNVAGPTIIYLNSNSGGGFSELGFTRDGAMITPESYWAEVKCDDNGGEGGPASEIQYLGETARIRLELTKYDSNNVYQVEYRMNTETGYAGGTLANSDQAVTGGQFGQVAYPGTLVFANKFYFALCLQFLSVIPLGSSSGNPGAATHCRIYPRCIPRHGLEFNKGTKFSTFVVEFEAFRSAASVTINSIVQPAGLLYYETTSVPASYTG
jgi:hypothetical protein